MRKSQTLPQKKSKRPATIATFAATAGLLFAYAIDAGAYDLIARQRFGLLVWWSLLLVAALGLRPLRRPGVPVALTLFALGGLALLAAVSLSWSQSDERTLAEVARTLHHLGLFALVLVLAGRRYWLAVVGGTTLAAALICGVALGVRLAPEVFGEDFTANAFSTNRLSRPLGYWNGIGAWAAMTAGVLLAWSGHARHLWVRCAALAAVPAVLAVLYLSYSRAGLIELAFVVVLVVAFAGRRWATVVHAGAALGLAAFAVSVIRSKPEIAELTGTAGRGSVLLVLGGCAVAAALVAIATEWVGLCRFSLKPAMARKALVFGGLGAVIAVALAGSKWGPRAWEQFSNPATVVASSSDPAARLSNLSSLRYVNYDYALRGFKAEPWQGSGAGTYEFVFNQYGGQEHIRDAHSLYLEQLSELGVVGGLLALLLLGGAAAILITARRRVGRRKNQQEIGAIAGCAAAGGAFLVAAGVDWMWELTAVAAFFFILLGAAAAATQRRRTARAGIGGRIVVSAISVGAIAVMLPGLVSSSQIRESQEAFAKGHLISAERAAEKAEEAAPWAATPYLQMGLLDEQSGRLGEARSQLLAAQQREPTNWRIPLILSRVEAELGNPRTALAAYRDSLRLRPAREPR